LAGSELTSNEAVGQLDNTMLRHSLPASGTSRNQNTAADRDATSGRLSAWSGGYDVVHPTSTSDAVMRAPWQSFWFRLGSHMVEPHGNHHASDNDVLGSGSFVYVQSDQQTIADYGVGDAPSSPLYRYVYASYIDEPVVRKGAGTGGTIHHYHSNQQYSITAVTTSAGAIAERYAYSAYGEPTICDSSGSIIASSSINNRYS